MSLDCYLPIVHATCLAEARLVVVVIVVLDVS
jgi:hypothetical protein